MAARKPATRTVTRATRRRRPGSRAGELTERHRQKAIFLETYAKVATITAACQACGVGRRTHYEWLKHDPEYAAKFAEADEAATDRLEQECRRRAIVGTEEPVYYKGTVVGAIRKYSDLLLIFLLKAKRPALFRETYRYDPPPVPAPPERELTDADLDREILALHKDVLTADPKGSVH